MSDRRSLIFSSEINFVFSGITHEYNGKFAKPITLDKKDLFTSQKHASGELQSCYHVCKYNGSFCEEDHQFYFERCLPDTLEDTLDRLRERYLVAAYANPTGANTACMELHAETGRMSFLSVDVMVFLCNKSSTA